MSKAGDFRMLKLYAVPYGVTARQLREGGRHADCWHVGGTNHDCFVRVDASGTPRLERVLTPALQPGGLLRVAGQGVDGGLRGEAKVKARLVQAGGGQSIGCNSRYADDPTNALAHSDATSFSCRLDASAASLSGFFDLKLKVLANDRGDAYAAQATSKQLDVAGGATFDAEVLPRIASVAPRSGSAAGGTDLTVAGSGFGSNKTAIRVVVGGAHCAVTELSERSLTCRIEALSADAPSAAARLASAPGERGVRWRHGEGDGGDVVVDAFATPAWAPSPTQPSTIDGWFESPCDCDVTFTVRGGGAGATLRWSGGEGAAANEVLAAVSGGGPPQPSGLRGRSPRRGGAPPRSLARCRWRRASRHFLSLACAAGAGGCAVGARVHTPLAPPSLMPAARRLAARAAHSSTCDTITSAAACCAAVDAITTEPCVPAEGALWAARHARASEAAKPANVPYQAACPARRRRTPLADGVGCPDVSDRKHCCASSDGRSEAYYKGQPCVASVERYKDGYVCQTARHVGLYEPAYAMASCAEFGDPYLGSGAVRHDVQRLTLSQDSAQWLEQRIVFEAIECPGTYSCLGGTVRITHGGAKSAPINIRNPSDADVKNAFAPLADGWYAEAGLAAAVDCDSGVSCNNTHVTWVVKLRVAWDACGRQRDAPLLGFQCHAKGGDHPRRHSALRLVLGRRRLPE